MPGLARLRELSKSATPGPWHSTRLSDRLPRNDDGDIEWPANLGERFPQHWDVYLQEDDAELIVQLRNSLPSVLVIIEAGRELMNAWNSDVAFAARAKMAAALQRLEDV